MTRPWDDPADAPGHLPGDDEEGFAHRSGARVTDKVTGRTGRVDSDHGSNFIGVVWDGSQRAVYVRADRITVEVPPLSLDG